MAKQPKNKLPSYSQQHRIAQAKAHEFSLIETFHLGYRNREDITNLPPGVLIQGSQNVVTSVTNAIEIVKGYILDGQADPTSGGFLLQEDGFYIQQEDVSLIAL